MQMYPIQRTDCEENGIPGNFQWWEKHSTLKEIQD